MFHAGHVESSEPGETMFGFRPPSSRGPRDENVHSVSSFGGVVRRSSQFHVSRDWYAPLPIAAFAVPGEPAVFAPGPSLPCEKKNCTPSPPSMLSTICASASFASSFSAGRPPIDIWMMFTLSTVIR